MRTVTAFDAKTRFGELLDRVSRGEEIVITRHDRPVARIVPEGRRSAQRTRDAVAGLNALRARIAARTKRRVRVTDADVRAAIDHGRL
jgi:prevent-host-death family protein